jgi:hypothetical protein
MFKKVSYLASVSILAGIVANTGTQAVFENELLDEIRHYNARQAAKKTAVVQPAESEEASGIYSSLKAAGNLLGDGLYKGAGFAQNWVNRPGTDLKIIEDAKNYSISQMEDSSYGLIGKALSYLPAKPLANMFFSATRTASSYLISEDTVEGEDTLARTIRNFWVKKNYHNSPEEVFPSTACALLKYSANSGDEVQVSDAVAYYKETFSMWNGRFFNSEISLGERDQYFLDGAIRHFVHINMPFSAGDEKTFGINMHTLPVAEKITIESLYPNEIERKAISQDKLEKDVDTARAGKLKAYIDQRTDQETRALQMGKKLAAKAVTLPQLPQSEHNPASPLALMSKDQLAQSTVVIINPTISVSAFEKKVGITRATGNDEKRVEEVDQQ